MPGVRKGFGTDPTLALVIYAAAHWLAQRFAAAVFHYAQINIDEVASRRAPR
jgi:hypothetical protein